MADKKITQLNNITGANLVDADEFVVVDISADETKAITLGELKEAFDAGSGFVRVTGDTMTGNLGFGDNDKAFFGAGSDLQIYSTGANGFIENNTGLLILKNNSDDRDIALQSDDGAGGVTNYLLADGSTGALNAYHYGGLKLATSATGISVTGTITADGLEIDKGGIGETASFSGDDASGARALQIIASTTTNTGDTHSINSQSSTGILKLSTANNTTRMAVFPSGDISFYEDTGTTPKFFWDASAESLGIGTAAPDTALTVSGGDIKATGSARNQMLVIERTDAANDYQYQIAGGSSQDIPYLTIRDAKGGGDVELVRFTQANLTLPDIGATTTTIGVADASSNYFNTSGRGSLILKASSALSGSQAQSGGRLILEAGNSYNGQSGQVYIRAGKNLVNNTKAEILFQQGLVDSARFDANGNLLVGTTDSQPYNNTSGTGFAVAHDGYFSVTRNGPVAYFNRNTSNGDIAVFLKDGAIKGAIGNNASGGGLTIYSTARSGIAFYAYGTAPTDGSGIYSDNTQDLGASTVRWSEIYASNATINTSDANEKQDVAALTATEMLVAARISTGFKTFRWIDSVADKGDDARTHTGVIAQDVQAAFVAEGLDAGDYSLFTSTTWWETQTDVAAVDAVEAVDAAYDDYGNELTSPVEAADAYTRTDTFDTLAEAPEGATERTRMGIRYPELLAFVGAYNEQRFASIETRLSALEG